MRCRCWRQNYGRGLHAIPVRRLAMIGRVEATVAVEAEGVAACRAWTELQSNPADGQLGCAAVRPVGFGIRTIIGGLEAKGFFARKLVSIIPSVPVIHGSVSCPVHVPSANHTSSYGWIYARSRLRLDRLCRNGGRSGFFP